MLTYRLSCVILGRLEFCGVMLVSASVMTLVVWRLVWVIWAPCSATPEDATSSTASMKVTWDEDTAVERNGGEGQSTAVPTFHGIAEFAGLKNDGRSRRGGICRAGKWRTGKWRTENYGVELEQTYILHTMKWTQTNVYDVVIISRTNPNIYLTGIVWGTWSNNVIDSIDA